MVVARRRRRQRPFWVVIASLLTVVALAVNAAASSGPEGVERRLAALAYLDEVRPHVEASTRQGADFADVQRRAAELGRATVGRRLRQVARAAGTELRAVERLRPPEHLETAHSLLVASFAIRARAASAIERGLVRALDTTEPELPTAAFVRASQDLFASDRAYATFRSMVSRTNEAGMPTSSWQPGNPITPEEAAAFIAHLRSSTSLAPVHDVAVLLVSVEPTPVGMDGAAEVIPAVKSLRVNVVVANAGNDRQRRVPIVAEVRWGDGEIDTARQFVDLAPGQRATVTIGGLRMPPQGVTALSVNAGPVDGEANLGDNQRQKTLLQR